MDILVIGIMAPLFAALGAIGTAFFGYLTKKEDAEVREANDQWQRAGWIVDTLSNENIELRNRLEKVSRENALLKEESYKLRYVLGDKDDEPR
jgi:hypothetical protein